MPRTALVQNQNLLAWTNIPLAYSFTNLTSALATTGPTGANNAARLIANSTSGQHYAYISYTWIKGQRYTASFDAKAGPNIGGVYFSSGASTIQLFTLNGTTKDASTGMFISPTGESAKDSQIAWTKELRDASGNRTGWKRCFVSFIATTEAVFIVGVGKESTGIVFSGDGVNDYVDICNPQLNFGFGDFPINSTSGGPLNASARMRNQFLPGRNCLANSEDLGSAGWVSPNSLYRNTNLLLDARGEQRATQIVPTTGAGSKYVTSGTIYETVQAGDTITGSIEVGSSSFPYIAISYDGGSTVMWINLSNNTTGTLNGFSATVTDLGVTNSGGSWRRIDFSRTVGASGAIGLAIWPCDADASIVGTGDGATLNYVIGRTQLNRGGPFPYIRTNYPVIGATERVRTSSRTVANRNQNLIANSNDIGSLTAQDMTSVTKTIVDPFGNANSAWLAIANTNGASGHYIVSPLPSVTTSSQTRSIWVKKTGSWDYALFWSPAIGYSYFNMSTGSFAINLHSFTAQNYGNGWYRIFTPSGYANPPTVVGVSSKTDGSPDPGDGTINTSIGMYNHQIVDANWEGEPTVTSGAANTNGIRNLAL